MKVLGRLVRIRYVRGPLLLAALAGFLVLCGLLLAVDKQPAFAAPDDDGLVPLGEIPPSAQQVIVGVYPISIYNIDYAGNTYFAEAYVWMRWQGEINPMESLEFVNIVDRWSLMMIPLTEEPIEMPDGSLYQGMRISGRFSQPFVMDRYPLDEQKLTILIEHTTHRSSELVYVTDNEDSGYGELLRVPGWRIANWSIESLLHKYDSRFGQVRSDANSEESYATLRFQLTIHRSLNFFVWKLLLPLLIVLSMSLATLLIHPTQVDLRMSLPTTGLLTTVFLQQSYTSSLPDTGNLVLLDRIYVLAYLVIIATLITAMRSAHQMEVAPDNAASIRRIDRIVLAAASLLMIAGSLWMIFIG